ncbi:MAG: phytoene synthase [Bradymonadia bacterium]|jgi:phytoene synthase
MTDVVTHSVGVLAKHAKSFRWASRLLPSDTRDDAAVVYALCRLIDDLADEADDEAEARLNLAELQDELEGRSEPSPLVEAFLALSKRTGLPVDAVVELINGVRSDLDTVRFRSERDLLRYCYRVAGTVGLMMCGVLGVRDPRAIAFAIDLGVAMQLTNISRDILEDARNDRVYLPKRLLESKGGSHDLVLHEGASKAVPLSIARLLQMADEYYASAEHGFRYIPWRCRAAIAVAGRVYRAIGLKLARNSCRWLDGRTVVGTLGKVGASVLALAKLPWLALKPPVSHQHLLHSELDGLPGANAGERVVPPAVRALAA